MALNSVVALAHDPWGNISQNCTKYSHQSQVSVYNWILDPCQFLVKQQCTETLTKYKTISHILNSFATSSRKCSGKPNYKNTVRRIHFTGLSLLLTWVYTEHIFYITK